MKNEFKALLKEHNVTVAQRFWVDTSENRALSVISQYGYHFRDDHGIMHIASHNNPQYVMLNVMPFFKTKSGEWDVHLKGRHSCEFTDLKEFNSYVDKMKKKRSKTLK